MVQDDNTTSSDLRASRSAHRFVKEQEAKSRAAPTSRSPTPGAQSSEVDVESRNNRRSHRDRHSPHRDRDHGRSRRHRSHDRKDDNGNRHRDDRHRRHRSGSYDRDDLDREAKRRAQHGRSRSSSHDRDDLDGEAKRRAQHGRSRSGSNDQEVLDREAKRRAQPGRSTSVGATSVGATSVGAGTSNSTERSSTRKNREEEDRRSKQRARRPNSTSGTPTPGATAASRGDSVSKGSVSREDARERKLRRAGLGLDGSDREDTGPQKNDNLPAAPPAAAAAAAGGDDDGAVQLQAMLVDDDGENSNLKKDIQAENERMKRELAEQNERMRQQMQEDQERFLEERRQQEQAEAAEKKRKQRRNVCILVIFLLATAIGVGAYFATKEGGSESTSAAVPPATQAPVTQAPVTTNVPIPPAPTAAPIAPEVTAAPTAEEPLHDAPSDMDCVAIANAATVEGQEEDTEKVLGFDTLLEMTLSTSTDPKLFSDDLKEQMQKRIMPKMAGCESAQFVDRKNLRNRRRELQANKYVVLNAQIDSTDVLDEACSNSDESNCFKVLAKMNLFLQGEEKKTVLVEKIDKLLKGKENNEDFELARKLGLSNFVTSLTCVGVYPNDPTPAPSQNPTNTPSVPPTNPPTGDQATPRPTPKPTPNPTPAPTPKPTEEECTDRCQGDRACESFDLDRFDVGCGSCNGAKSCLDARAFIGEESCLEGGCEGVSGEIGDRSCHGRKACRDLVNVEIGNDSCRCEGCCACIRDDDFIPSGSCNSIAETRNDVEYKPYETTERVEFCCLEPGSGGGEGDSAPPAPPEG